MNLYTITFSPTGGTQKVADCIAMGFEMPFMCIDLCVQNWNAGDFKFSKDDICIVAMPAYGGRIPAIAAQRLNELKGNGAIAVPAAVYGNRAIDDTLVETQDILTENGFICIAGIEAVAEHSIVRAFAAGRPDADDAQQLMDFGRQILAKINTASLTGNIALPGNRPYKQWGGSSMKPVTLPGCNRCGMCISRCPTGAITKKDPAETDFEKCVSCMQCISACPLGARRLDPDAVAVSHEKMLPICSGHKENRLYI